LRAGGFLRQVSQQGFAVCTGRAKTMTVPVGHLEQQRHEWCGITKATIRRIVAPSSATAVTVTPVIALTEASTCVPQPTHGSRLRHAYSNPAAARKPNR
jgi:hypothetical protein